MEYQIKELMELKTLEEIDAMNEEELKDYQKLLEKRYTQEQINIMVTLDQLTENNIKAGVVPKREVIILGKLSTMPDKDLEDDDVYTHSLLDPIQAIRFDFKYLKTDKKYKNKIKRERLLLQELQKYKDSL